MDPKDLCEFWGGYISTAMWASTTDTGESLEYLYAPADILKADLAEMKEEALAWAQDNADLVTLAIEATGNTWKDVGHHLWLTRNGHGAGFWDGAWGSYGDDLTHQARTMGSCSLREIGDGTLAMHY